MIAGCLLLGSCMRSQSTYYVDPRGDDNNDGRSSATAWKTIAKVNSTGLSAGDRVLFVRGGLWHESLSLTSSGSSSDPIIYGAFGSGPKPVIDLGATLPGWTSPGNWHDQGGNVWSMSFGYWPGRMWFNGTESGCPGFSNATSAYNNTYGSSVVSVRYRWWWNSGVLYVYSSGNPASAYSSIEIGQASNGISNSWSGKSHVTFQNMEFRRGETAIYLDNCDYITFDSCKVGGGSSRWGVWARHGSDHGLITNNCIFDREDTVKHQMEYGGSELKGNATDIVAINCGSYWEIRDSYFGSCGHAGVNLDDGDGNGVYCQYNKIHDCEFYGGGDYDRAFLMNSYGNNVVRGCAYNEFYNNYVHGMETVSQMGGLNNKVYYNIWSDQGHIPWETDINSWRSDVITFTDDHYQDSCYILNNTFYNADRVQISIPGGSRHCFVENNILFDGGNDNNPNCPHIAIILWLGAQTNIIKSNVIFSPSSSLTCIVNQDQYMGGYGTPRTVAYMQANPGQNTISGNITADPRLLSDGRIATTSPARDSGLPVGLTGVDFFGTPLPATRPDIGACEVPLTGASTDVPAESSSAPGGFLLEQNYPNPFNPTTSIRFALPRESRVVLEVFNVLGQSVARLVDEVASGGIHQAQFDGRALASGTYIYRLQVEGQAPLVRKMSVLK